jgi:hypothetical protein
MAVLFDERTPTWEALRLGRHLMSLKVALVPYFLCLLLFWLQVFGVVHMPVGAFNVVGWTLGLTYLFMVAETFYIQKVLHDSAVYKHGAWHVLIGAMCLNPCALGWWMPLSVLWASAKVRVQLEDLHSTLKAKEQRNAIDGAVVGPRRPGASWMLSPIAAIVGAFVAILALFLLWHFAAIQKPSKDPGAERHHNLK